VQNRSISFNDIPMECQSGLTELYTESLGLVTYVGFSRHGDAVIQSGHDGVDITTIPELTWNLMNFVIPWEPETHVRFISEKSLEDLHGDAKNYMLADFSSVYGIMYPYEVTMHIKRIYN
jgi:hypothetical protein